MLAGQVASPCFIFGCLAYIVMRILGTVRAKVINLVSIKTRHFVGEMAAEVDELIKQIEDELNEPLTDPVKESTVEYYLDKKDKVGHCLYFIT